MNTVCTPAKDHQPPALIDWFRSAATLLLGSVLLTLTVTWPACVVLALVQPAYRVAGAALVMIPATLIVWSTGLTRSSLALILTYTLTPSEPQLRRLCQQADHSRTKIGTCLLTTQQISRPWVFRGLRWTFIMATDAQYDDPALIVQTVRDARRRGIDRAVLMMSAIIQVYRAWCSAMRTTSSTVRPGPRNRRTRVRLSGMIALFPICAASWVLSWICVQTLRAIAPAPATMALLELGNTDEMIPRGAEEEIAELGRANRRIDFSRQLVNSSTVLTPVRSPVRRTGLRTPEAFRRAGTVGAIPALVQVVSGMLLIGVGTFAGWGIWPAQRIVWPWESAPESAQVIAVEDDGAGGGALIDYIGLDIATVYTPEVLTDSGQPLTLPGGTTPVRVGDTVHIVTSGASVRWLEQDAMAKGAVLGSIYLALACVLQYAALGIRLFVASKLKQIDYDQRVLTGRPHRRHRPRLLLGIDI